jgi:hypothetical protein
VVHACWEIVSPVRGTGTGRLQITMKRNDSPVAVAVAVAPIGACARARVGVGPGVYLKILCAGWLAGCSTEERLNPHLETC